MDLTGRRSSRRDGPGRGRGAEDGLNLLPPPRSAIAAGSVIGDFEVVREVGSCGLALILEARDRSLGTRVGLKVLDPRLAGSPRAVSRFRVEAALAARVSHPGIVPVICRGSKGGWEFYAEPFFDGPTLVDLLDDGPGMLGDEDFQDMALRFAGLARGVDALHHMGIIHRSIRPSNIFVEGGRFLLGDFKVAVNYLALELGEGTEMPEDRFGVEGLIRNEPFLAPEEFLRGVPVRPPSDIYAIGLTLYQAATGRLPFPICSREDLARLKLTRDPVPPRRLNLGVPIGLEAVIRQAIALRLDGRHETAADLATDLERFAAGKRGATRRHVLRSGPLEAAVEEGGGEDLFDLAGIA